MLNEVLESLEANENEPHENEEEKENKVTTFIEEESLEDAEEPEEKPNESYPPFLNMPIKQAIRLQSIWIISPNFIYVIPRVLYE